MVPAVSRFVGTRDGAERTGIDHGTEGGGAVEVGVRRWRPSPPSCR